MINFNCISACYISKLAMTVIIFLVVNNLWPKASPSENQIVSLQCLQLVRKYLILHTALRVLSPCNGFPISCGCRYSNKLSASNFLLPLAFMYYQYNLAWLNTKSLTWQSARVVRGCSLRTQYFRLAQKTRVWIPDVKKTFIVSATSFYTHSSQSHFLSNF